jgi:hypothetical protein
MDQENQKLIESDDNINQKLFDWVYNAIIADGGDGYALIGFTAQSYKVVAEQFELFLSKQFFGRRWIKDVHTDYICFHDREESIILTDKHGFENIITYGIKILTW